jgi:exosortase E/protease (VPEID-CTERM system)
MPTDTTYTTPVLSRRPALILAAILLVLELGLLGAVYKHMINFTCLANWPLWACSGASGVLVAVYALLAAITLYFILKPGTLGDLLDQAGQSLRPLIVNVVGFLVTMIPIGLLTEGSGTTMLWPTLGLWALGFSMLAAGLLLFVAPVGRWRALIAADGLPLGGVVLAGIAAPFLATLIRPIWNLDTIANATFQAVSFAVTSFGYEVDINVPDKIIGKGDFLISIAPVCSGIEGIALVTVFVTLYLALFRSELRFPLAFILYPAGILVSACLNIVRITVLLIFGLEGYPELAVGGFHSHAGWLMFTLVALGVVLAARSVPALQKAPVAATGMGGDVTARAPLPPLRQDENASRIIPFAIFMFSAMLAQAFSQSPGVIYPLRALAMAAAVGFFWEVYKRLDWRPTGLSLAAGAAIGIMWIAIPYNPADTSPAHGGLTGALLVGWLIARGIGTILLVPIIEELFFRDYLESKLRKVGGPIVAGLITASLFALLHDRWAEAFVAGVVFSWIMAQRKNVVDAIAAHLVANAIVYGFALATMQMHII